MQEGFWNKLHQREHRPLYSFPKQGDQLTPVPVLEPHILKEVELLVRGEASLVLIFIPYYLRKAMWQWPLVKVGKCSPAASRNPKPREERGLSFGRGSR